MDNQPRVYSSLPQEEHNAMHNTNVVVKAKGPYVWMDDDTEPYIDFVMGYSTSNFGHLNDDILTAFNSLTSDNVVFFISKEREELIQKFGKALGLDGNWNFYFPVGGSMAVEAAARACLLAKPDGVLLSFVGAFHGYGGVSRVLTDRAFLKSDVFMESAKSIKSPRPLDLGSDELALKALEDNLKNNVVAGLFIEPVQGASGFNDFGAEFLKGVRELCTKYDVPMVCDEIQSSMFRCGSLMVCLSRSVVPDIMLVGKSFGGGVVPISAVIMSNEIAKKLPIDHAAFDSTFSGWTVGVSVALKTLSLIEKNDFAKDVATKGILVDKILDEELTTSDLRARVRRVGLAIAFDGKDSDESEKLRLEMMSNHVIIQTSGVDGAKCKLSPAITIPEDVLENGIRKFSVAIKKVVAN